MTTKHLHSANTAQKMEFSVKNLFSKCEENFIFLFGESQQFDSA